MTAEKPASIAITKVTELNTAAARGIPPFGHAANDWRKHEGEKHRHGERNEHIAPGNERQDNDRCNQ